MSRLSFRLLLFDVFADLHFVFLLGIFVGNFIFSFLLFSCREEEEGQQAESRTLQWDKSFLITC